MKQVKRLLLRRIQDFYIDGQRCANGISKNLPAAVRKKAVEILLDGLSVFMVRPFNLFVSVKEKSEADMRSVTVRYSWNLPPFRYTQLHYNINIPSFGNQKGAAQMRSPLFHDYDDNRFRVASLLVGEIPCGPYRLFN